MTMRQPWKPWTALGLVLLVGLTACSYDAALRRLSPAEQSEWSLYRHRMTGVQAWTYLAKASAAERTAYLRAIGLPQRFAALDPLDQQAVRNGWPRVGISAEALLFVWGEPEYTEGDAQRSAHWHYLGSSLALGASGNQSTNFGSRVDVYLTDGKVVGWVDGARPDDEKGESGCAEC
jgi:hypothetical protein